VIEQLAPAVEVQAGGFVLFPLPAGTHPEIETATGKDIEGGGHLGQHDRTAQGGQQDVRCQLDAGGDAAHHGQDRERVQPQAVGAGGLPAAVHPAEFATRERRQIVTEHDAVGHHDAACACPAGRPGRSSRCCQLPGSAAEKAGRVVQSPGVASASGLAGGMWFSSQMWSVAGE
jgi:hypothetical protein